MILTKPALKYASPLVKWQPDASTVLWLPGQNDAYASVIRDFSGYNNHGTITGAIWVRLPSGLWVNSFDGTDDVITGDLATELSQPYTLLLWVKAITHVQNDSFFSGKNVNGANLFMWNAGEIYYNNTIQIGPATGITTTSWNLYGIIVNGAASSITVNGVEKATGDLGTATLTGYRLGSNQAGNIFADIQTGLPRMLNVALSATQIAGIFNQERHLFGV